MSKLTRQQVARHLTDHLDKGRAEAIREAAAWLIATKRTSEARYLVGDVAVLLEKEGIVSARVISATPLSTATKKHIESTIKAETGAKELTVVYRQDISLVGGVRIETPSATLDTSIRARLDKLVKEVTA